MEMESYGSFNHSLSLFDFEEESSSFFPAFPAAAVLRWFESIEGAASDFEAELKCEGMAGNTDPI